MAEEETKPGYDVGYAKPPQTTRFKPGQSGNLKGRPKGAKNFSTVLNAELKSRIPITENGKRKKITKQEAIVKQLVNKAVAGDQRSMPVLLNEIRQREGLVEDATATLKPPSQEDQLVMSSILKRIQRAGSEKNNEGGHHKHQTQETTSSPTGIKNDTGKT